MAFGVNIYQQDSDISLANFGARDKFGNSSQTDSGNVTNMSFTGNRSTISGNVGYVANTIYNFWNKTVINTNGTSFRNAAAGGGTHINWYNCQLDTQNIVGGLTATNQGVTFGGVDIAGNVASGRSWNLYNSLVTLYGTAAGGGYIFDDAFDSTISFQNGNTQGFYGGTYTKTGANMVRSALMIPTTSNTGQFGEHTLRGVPGRFEETVFLNTRLAQNSFSGNVLLIAPDFPRAEQPYYYAVQTQAQPGKGYMVVGPYIWAYPQATNARTSDFATKISWGGAGGATGQHIIQFHGYDATFYQDANATQLAEGIRVYVSTNMRTGALTTTDVANFNTRFAASPFTVNTSHQIISDYSSSSTGRLQADRYSTNGGTGWTDGYFNWGRLTLNSSATPTDVTFNTFNNQSLASGVIASPIMAARKTDGNNNPAVDGGRAAMAGQAGMETTIDIRGYAYSNGVSTNTYDSDYYNIGANSVEVTNVINTPSLTVKASNIVASDKASNANIQAVFSGDSDSEFTINDLHDAARWLWSDYQNSMPPEVTEGIATFYQNDTDTKLNLMFDTDASVGFAISGQTVTYRVDAGHTMTVPTGEAVTGLDCLTLTLAGAQVRGGSVVPDFIREPHFVRSALDSAGVIREAAFRECAMQGAVIVDIGSTDAYIAFSNCTFPTGKNFTISRASGNTGTLYVYGVDDSLSHVSYGTGVVNAPLKLFRIRNNLGQGNVYYAISQLDTDTNTTPVGTEYSGFLAQDSEIAIDSGTGNLRMPFGSTVRVVFSKYGYSETIQNVQGAVNSAGTTQMIDATMGLTATPFAADTDYLGSFTVHTSNVASASGMQTVGGVTYHIPGSNTLAATGERFFILADTDSNGQFLQLSDVETVTLLQQVKDSSAYARTVLHTNTPNLTGFIDGTTGYLRPEFAVFLPNGFSDKFVTGIVNPTTGDTYSSEQISLFLDTDVGTFNVVSIVRNQNKGTGVSAASLELAINRINQHTTTETTGVESHVTSEVEPLY